MTLIHQLPVNRNDPIRDAFYDPSDNWFYKMFKSEGYDAGMVANTLHRWLSGRINSLVLCGSNLANAKTVFNAILNCFPGAVVDTKLNSMYSLHKCSMSASIYCVPYVDSAPNPLMLHLMEGNSTNCLVGDEVVHIKSIPILVHCSELSLAQTFIANNIAVLFLTGNAEFEVDSLLMRNELSDFVHHADAHHCMLTLHCKSENPLCEVCINKNR